MARFGSYAIRLAACLAAASLLAACNRTAPPAPFELHTRAGPPTLSEPTPTTHPDRIVVGGGDTLYGLSRRYGVPMRAIIDANALTPPFRLVAGISLVLPQVRTHLVQPGDTLANVSQRHGVDASTLAATNHLAPPYLIRTGETLVLPAQVEAALPAPAKQPLVAVVPLPAPSAGTAASAAPLVTAPLPAPPAAAVPSAAPPAAVPLAAPPPTATRTEAVAAAPRSSTANPLSAPPSAPTAPPPVPEVAAAPAVAGKPPPETASFGPVAVPVQGSGFLWPVRGRVIAAYGTGPQGTHNDGINIAAAAGTPVLAADAGEVAYVGNELRGYGNLILVKHVNGFITAYAHNETVLVKRGDRVTRGQPIAKVGATGAVSEPQLHFEIRRGARVLDPSEYLPAQTATARP